MTKATVTSRPRPPNAAPKSSARGQNKAKRRSPKASPSKGEKYFGFWKNFWAFAGPLFTILGLGNYYTPSVTITSGVNLDPKQSLQTQFLVTNSGNVRVHDLIFACTFKALVMPGSTASIGVDGAKLLTKIDELNPKSTISKGCFTQSNTAEGTVLRVVNWFRWPLINYQDRVEAYFVVRKGSDGFFLVPDSPPNATSPMALPPIPEPPPE